jgi:hypothetical protein
MASWGEKKQKRVNAKPKGRVYNGRKKNQPWQTTLEDQMIDA